MNCMCVVCCNSKRSGLFVCAVDCKARFVGDTVPADGQVNLEVCFRCELHTLRTSPPTLPSPRIFLFYTCTHGVDFFVLHLYTWSWFFCFTLVHMELIFLFYTCTHGVDFFVLHLYTWSWFFCFTLVHMGLIFLFYTCTHGVDFSVLHLYTWSCRTCETHVFMRKVLSGEAILYVLNNWQQTETNNK